MNLGIMAAAKREIHGDHETAPDMDMKNADPARVLPRASAS